jgi:IS5 family transposase
MGPPLEVADVFRRHGEAFRQANAGHLGRVERRVMGAVTACRTAVLGGHVEQCDDCGATRIAYNSCRNRHCPKCQGPARAQWLAERRTLRTYLGRIIRDIARKIEGNASAAVLSESALGRMLALARRVLDQKQHQRGPKVYSLHAPEVECIGKGKAHRPYEFGVKVSVATTLAHAKGGQFVTHVKALPGNPYDGHTLATVIPEMEALIGNTIERLLADKGYRGHNAPPDYKFRVFTSGQKRRMTPKIKRELRRRSAVEPVIGHLKSEHRMGRNYLWHRQGDATNAVLAAVGYNFRRLIRWISLLLSQILALLVLRPQFVQG